MDSDNKFHKCTVLISSCDSYEDTWEPFFRIMDIQWPDCPYPIVLNTESKQYSYKNFEISCPNHYVKGQKVAWGERLIHTLKAINTEYVIFLLDDFFFTNKVDQKRIEMCISWMDNDTDISVFSFRRTHQPNIKDGLYPCFERRPQDAEYRLNCQAAVWRREDLISYIKPHETPWEWEIYGSRRSRKYTKKFYSAIEGAPYVFDYDIMKYGVIRGKWAKTTVPFFEQFGINNVDYEHRGFADEDNPYGDKEPYSMKSHFPKDIVTKEFWKQIWLRMNIFYRKTKSLYF